MKTTPKTQWEWMSIANELKREAGRKQPKLAKVELENGIRLELAIEKTTFRLYISREAKSFSKAELERFIRYFEMDSKILYQESATNPREPKRKYFQFLWEI